MASLFFPSWVTNGQISNNWPHHCMELKWRHLLLLIKPLRVTIFDCVKRPFICCDLRLCITPLVSSWTCLCADVHHLCVYKAGDIRGTAPLATIAGWKESKSELFMELSLLSALLNWNHSVLTGPALSSSPYHVLKPPWGPLWMGKWWVPLIFHQTTVVWS